MTKKSRRIWLSKADSVMRDRPFPNLYLQLRVDDGVHHQLPTNFALVESNGIVIRLSSSPHFNIPKP